MATGWYSNVGMSQTAYPTAWPHATPYTQSSFSLPPAIAPAQSTFLTGGYAARFPSPSLQIHDVEYPKAKKPRASKACDQCRNRKQRCDEGSPCSYCKEFSLVCNYQAPLPTKFDKVAELMTTWMSAHTEGLKTLAEKLNTLEALLTDRTEEKNVHRLGQRAAEMHSCSHEPLGRSTVLTGRRTSTNTIRGWPVVRHLLGQCQPPREQSQFRPVGNSDESRSSAGAVFEDRSPGDCAANGFNDDALPASHFETTVQLGKRKHERSEETSGPNLQTECTLPKASVGQLYQSFLGHFHHFYPFLDLKCISLQIKSMAACKHAQKKPRRFDYSPRTAIVLLVLALGEIGQCGNLHVLSDQLDNSGPRSSTPGMRFYNQAMRCAGAHLDGSDLVHARIFLLAGLYKAQLSRMNEAASWYGMAGRVLTHLVQRQHLCTQAPVAALAVASTHRSCPQHRSLVLAAAWTCIELEAGIADGMQSYASGLGQLADRLPLPAQAGADGVAAPDGQISLAWTCYRARVKLLRDSLARQSHFAIQGASSTNILDAFKHEAKALQQWRCSLPPELQWNDKDPPSKDVLLSKVRANYWKTKIQLLLPFLDYSLHILPERRRGVELNKIAHRHSQDSQVIAAIDSMYTSTGLDEILLIARLCVEAIKQNIKVFDAVSERPVNLDVQAAAGDRFEHSLLLAAIFDGAYLDGSIEEEQLHDVLRGTIAFLEKTSSTCLPDLGTMVRVKSHLFLA